MESDKLKERVMACAWMDLVPHFARGALLLVSPGLNLIEAAIAIASDDAAGVAGLLDSGSLNKLTDEEAKHYGQAADTRFHFIVLQPYVLAQEVPAASTEDVPVH